MSKGADEVLKERVKAAIKGVKDPELGASLMGLGMIKDVRVKEGVAEVDMMLTTPFCPLAHYMVADVKRATESVKGIKKAVVRIVGYGPPRPPVEGEG